jgi:hypothetical protein
MDNQLHILDAKKEYMTRLSRDLAPYVMSTFQQLYEKKKTLIAFQQELRHIPSWNEHEIQTLTTTIENQLAVRRGAKNTYLSSLISMTFVAIVKVMSSVRVSGKQNPSVRLKLPSNTQFVHRVYIESARVFYDCPELIRSSNNKQTEAIGVAVDTAVRELIPYESILDVYLSAADADQGTVPPILSPQESSEEEDEEPADDSSFPHAYEPQHHSTPIREDSPPPPPPSHLEEYSPPPPPPQQQQQEPQLSDQQVILHEEDIPTRAQYQQQQQHPIQEPVEPDHMMKTAENPPYGEHQAQRSRLYADAQSDEDFQ